MPLQKFTPKSGVNRENTRLLNEGGWYESEKVRFRQGTPEKIGGWAQISSGRFKGVCRTLWTWADIAGRVITGVGTNLKFMLENVGDFYDITPAQRYVSLSGPFAASAGSAVITVTDAGHGAATGDYVTFYNAQPLSLQLFTVTIASPGVLTLTTALANGSTVILSTTGALPTGLVAGVTYFVTGASGATCNLSSTSGGPAINTSGAQSGVHSLYVTTGVTAAMLTGDSFAVTVLTANTYTITVSRAAIVYDTAAGGTAVTAVYDIAPGTSLATATSGWGGGGWGGGLWGTGSSALVPGRVWNQNNFGQDLLYGIRGSILYYWNAVFGLSSQAVSLTIAAPCVASLPAVVPENTAMVFLTTGALPTGLTMGTVYYAKGVSGSTCNLSLTAGGAAITTSGTQSGTHTVSLRGIPLTAIAGASDVPVAQNFILVSDSSRIVIAFGVNPIGSAAVDPLFIRWSAQESATDWTPRATNQAGGVRLSHGAKIITALQTKQEILVWTDQSLYSMQYVGPPYVFNTQLMADNVSIAGPGCAAVASGITYWMGVDKFYKYDGRAQTLRCDLRQYVYGDINLEQTDQFFAGTNEGFNEVWFFYCSAASTTVDKYVIYNYVEDCWYYGNMARTAWIDSGLSPYPMAAGYGGALIYHEFGLNDNETGTPAAFESYILSSEFDIGDGDRFGFVWRVLPDVTFRGSTATSPSLTLTLYALQNAGSGYNNPASVGGTNSGTVTGQQIVTVEQFTGQINTRLRGRQMAMKVSSNQLDTTWQVGATRVDVRPDGRRGG